MQQDPKAEPAQQYYSRRLEELNALLEKDQGTDRLFISVKLLLGAVIVVSLIWMLRRPVVALVLVAALVALLIAVVLHERVLKRMRQYARLALFHERGLSRLCGTWACQGESGERFLDPAHPYARDLDLFGKASLFELLCTARTRAGEETLANWLQAPAGVEEIRARQLAVAELTPQAELRESLFALGESIRLGVRPEALAAWGEAKSVFNSTSLRIVTAVLAAAWILSLVAWSVWDFSWAAILLSIVNLGLTLRLDHRLHGSVNAIDKASQDLRLLTGTLKFLEGRHFTSPKLTQLQAVLYRREIPASRAVRKLLVIVEYLQSSGNWFVKIIDLFVFWSAQLVFAAEGWQKGFGPAIREWLNALGELEALAALSGYAYEHPHDVFAELTDEATDELPGKRIGGPAYFEAEAFAHPLIPEDRAVSNDLVLGGQGGAVRGGTIRLMIVSGPNMAGKSTFMRAIGVNCVLAQCGAPVRARRLRMSRLSVAASISVFDSLQGGVSRFYAEIRRIKLISDLTRGPLPVLFLLDELLSGTNSHDRLVGTQFIVRSMVDQGAIGIVTTHDLALTKIPDSAVFQEDGMRAINCHFKDHIDNGELKFDYRLSPGIVQTSNALVLMRSIGLDVAVEE
jgi:hypothetical protein